MFSQAVADEICSRLAEGQSLRAVCRDAEMPDATTVLRWAASQPEFAQQYAHARETGYALLGDEILEIVDNPDSDANHRRLQFDARRWMLSKMLPKVYGEKMEHEVKGNLTLTLSSQDERL